MNAIVKFFAKKYVISIINDMLESAARKTDIELWKARVKNVIQFCQYLSDALDDNKLTAEESEKIVDAAQKLVK